MVLGSGLIEVSVVMHGSLSVVVPDSRTASETVSAAGRLHKPAEAKTEKLPIYSQSESQ